MHMYRNSGVDINSGDEFVRNIRSLTDKTKRPEVIGSIGSFGGLVGLGSILKRYDDPVLVSSTDGVGSKLIIAQKTNRHDSIGIDLVAMCVNDIIVHGAEPLFFLDYVAIGKLKQDVAFDILKGISDGCILSNMSLVGGETAELPRIYSENKYDLAGFSVGIVEKCNILPKNIKDGDIIIGLESSGLHSNGFSLVLKMIEELEIKYDSISPFDARTWGDVLLEPTKIYVNSLSSAMHLINGISHITGGGISGNLPRIIPEGLSAQINLSSWDIPEIFEYIRMYCKTDINDLLSVFNCGIGMILIVSPEKVDELRGAIKCDMKIIGTITSSDLVNKISYI